MCHGLFGQQGCCSDGDKTPAPLERRFQQENHVPGTLLLPPAMPALAEVHTSCMSPSKDVENINTHDFKDNCLR